MHIDPKHDRGHAHAILVEVTRGPIVESVHFGAVAVADVHGHLRAWLGNPASITYYRSSSKPLQALPLVESGAADHFGFNDAEIAIMCGSHGGEQIHVETVRGILEKIGVGPDVLACGIHTPLSRDAARKLAERGESPTVLNNNCSGKHSGMIALARFHGWPIGGYETRLHPVQQIMLETVADFAGLPPSEVHVGTDGCGVCSFGISVHRMAMSFARLAQPDFWPEPRRSAIERIWGAITRHPEMVGYAEGNIDTDITRVANGMVLSKRGAEGVYCASKQGQGDVPALGFALKILDGDLEGRARNPAIIEGLRQAEFLDEDALNKLEGYWMEEVRNRPGDVVGMVRPAFTLLPH